MRVTSIRGAGSGPYSIFNALVAAIGRVGRGKDWVIGRRIVDGGTSLQADSEMASALMVSSIRGRSAAWINLPDWLSQGDRVKNCL